MSDIVRFSARQRVEHLSVMLLFTVLAVTGLPQKYFEADLSAAVVHALGGVAATRLIHRVAGALFSLTLALHLAVAVRQISRRELAKLAMVPGLQDYRDAVATLRWYLGLSREKALFDRYDYRQKFEYWGMLAGSLIMVTTGFALLFPAAAAGLAPGQLIPAARLAHSQEGLMALLVVIVWHVYNAHLNPDVFPFDWSIFTGRISRHRMLEEHPLELARIEGRPAPRAQETPMRAAGPQPAQPVEEPPPAA
ncbi:MAG TPA: cytochrome b/b6 domain-containing protein [Myxococcales bacterium]|nr:cytochrome b/b6 domain-containing protein [Myxococcales bacterium]